MPKLYAVVSIKTEKVVQETGAPFDAATLADAEREVCDTYFSHDPKRKSLTDNELLTWKGWKVVPLTKALERQYPDNASE